MTDSDDTFRPDWASPPGDTIADLIEERGWSQAELASRLGYSVKHISQLMNGKAPVTEDTALRLERVIGGPARFWLTREAQYRAQCARLDADRRNASWVDWCDELPVKELMNIGAVPKRRIDVKSKPALVEDLLRLFGVASPDEWERHYVGMQAAFRRARVDQSDMGAISAWLRLGEIQAEQVDGPRYDRARFQDVLHEIRTLTIRTPDEFEPQLKRLCLDAGVTLVLVPPIPRAHVSGVARWLGPHRALIQLSLYGKTNDRFWFTFFHEAAHILLHNKKGVFLDDIGQQPATSGDEAEADRWAGDFLIPPRRTAELPLLKSKDAVTAYARDLGIHPGIVVGRLQHDEFILPSWMNDLKVSFHFAPDAAAS
jgi:HTH-type transcriptional regulator / antitoxin HigA